MTNVDRLTSRGVLFGRDYAAGRGIWGVYGSYDYFAPDVFRFATTSVALGTSATVGKSDVVSIHGTGLLGIGYAGVQTATSAHDRDIRYGLAPKALVNIGLFAADRVSVDLTARDYLLDRSSPSGRRRDVVRRADATLAIRLFGGHGVGVHYAFSRHIERSHSPTISSSHRTVGAFYAWSGGRPDHPIAR